MHIELLGVTKSYGRTRALDKISATFKPGEIVAVIGGNGAGKSTLLRCLAGLAAPDEGSVFADDEKLTRDCLGVRRRIMFLPDFPQLFPFLSPLDNIGQQLLIHEADRPEVEHRVAALLLELDLLPLADVPTATLSRGQSYKTALAALLAVDPEVWLFDEPMASGMDPQGLALFRREARAAVQRGRTIVYSTQMIEVAERFSDRVMVLSEGQLRAFAPVVDLVTTSGQGLEELLVNLRDRS